MFVTVSWKKLGALLVLTVLLASADAALAAEYWWKCENCKERVVTKMNDASTLPTRSSRLGEGRHSWKLESVKGEVTRKTGTGGKMVR